MSGDLEDHLPEHVSVLRFRSESGNISSTTLHSPLIELRELRDDVLDNLNELENGPSPDEEMFDAEGLPDESILPRDTSQSIVALFVLSSALTESLTTKILKEEVIAEEFQNDKDVDSLFNRRSNLSMNLDLLRYNGAINQGLYSDLEDVRQTRNDLLHDHEERLSVHNRDALEQRIRKAVSGPEDMYDVLEELSNA
jgi:hypothetical protein